MFGSKDINSVFVAKAQFKGYIIRRLYNKDRDQGSKGIEGVGIDQMVTYST